LAKRAQLKAQQQRGKDGMSEKHRCQVEV